MKSIVLSAIICAAAVGNGVAKSTPMHDQKSVAAFKQVIAFHQRNVDVLWEQYEIAEARIKESPGNHAELRRDHLFFKDLYQQDINRGIRVAESKKAIVEIEANYKKKHVQRDAYEKAKIARLQEQLRTALKNERKGFEKSKKKYAHVVNAETRPLLQKAERHFAEAIRRADHFHAADTTLAIR